MYLFNASKRPTPPCRLGLSNINVPILERQRWFCTSILQSLSSSPGKDQFLSSKKLFLSYLGSRVIFSDHPLFLFVQFLHFSNPYSISVQWVRFNCHVESDDNRTDILGIVVLDRLTSELHVEYNNLLRKET